MICVPTFRGYCVAVKGKNTKSHKKFLDYIERLPEDKREEILKAFEEAKEDSEC